METKKQEEKKPKKKEQEPRVFYDEPYTTHIPSDWGKVTDSFSDEEKQEKENQKNA